MFFGIFEKRSANDFQRPNLRDPKSWSDLAGHSTISHSGEGVNEVNAMEITAFSSALNAVADAFCQLPIHIEKTRAGKTSRDNESHEASFVRDGGTINEDGTTAVDWLKGLILHYYTKGRASTLIERANDDRILNLWPLDPDKLAVKVRSVTTGTGLTREQRYFAYTDPNGQVHEYDVRNVIDLVRLHPARQPLPRLASSDGRCRRRAQRVQPDDRRSGRRTQTLNVDGLVRSRRIGPETHPTTTM